MCGEGFVIEPIVEASDARIEVLELVLRVDWFEAKAGQRPRALAFRMARARFIASLGLVSRLTILVSSLRVTTVTPAPVWLATLTPLWPRDSPYSGSLRHGMRQVPHATVRNSTHARLPSGLIVGSRHATGRVRPNGPGGGWTRRNAERFMSGCCDSVNL